MARVRFALRLLTRAHERTYWSQPAVQAAARALTRVGTDLIVANELESLPLALALGRPVLFDAHEYSPLEFEDSLRWRLTWAPYVRYLSRTYVPRVAAMSTVSEGIARRYEADSGVECAVVRNVRDRVEIEPSPVGDPIRLLHHGGADASRRLETMIDV